MWVRLERKSTEHAPMCCKVTKNLSGPQMEFLSKTPGFVDVENDDGEFMGIGTAHRGLSTSRTHTEAMATVSLIGGHSSGVDFNVGAGLSTGGGIKDDSISIKLLGCGIIFGRKMGMSFFDNSIAVDFGKVLDSMRRDGEHEEADLDQAAAAGEHHGVAKPSGTVMQRAPPFSRMSVDTDDAKLASGPGWHHERALSSHERAVGGCVGVCGGGREIEREREARLPLPASRMREMPRSTVCSLPFPNADLLRQRLLRAGREGRGSGPWTPRWRRTSEGQRRRHGTGRRHGRVGRAAEDALPACKALQDGLQWQCLPHLTNPSGVTMHTQYCYFIL